MGNVISLNSEHKNTDEWLCMSNGGTAVFISVMVLSGSRLATAEREKEFILWLAEMDQSVRGIGTVGFDISELPWSIDGFEKEKKFLIDVIDAAFNKLGWEVLDYKPSEEYVTLYLNKFRSLILLFEQKDIESNTYLEWKEESEDIILNGFPKCDKHGVYLSWNGCVVCNDN